MHTEVLAVDPVHPDPSIIERAAALLRAGEVVVFPTETVYGLGAAALQTGAVDQLHSRAGEAAGPLVLARSFDADPAAQPPCAQTGDRRAGDCGRTHAAPPRRARPHSRCRFAYRGAKRQSFHACQPHDRAACPGRPAWPSALDP